MPVTGPVTYYWVGGATGTTSASRFDWNVASNWRVKRNASQPLTQFNLTTPQMWPVGGDMVRLGYGWEFTPGATSSHRINSPLLFGGFSGSGGTGCWICGGETGAGLCGASGTTLQAALFSFTVDAYPFNGIGGGLTGNNIYGWLPHEYLSNSMPVSGMDKNAWEALGSAASTRQQSLNLKVLHVSHVGITGDYAGYSPWFAPNIIDTYSTYGVSGSTGYISTSIRYSAVVTPSSTYPSLYLKNNKIYEIIKYIPGGATGGTSPIGADPVNLYVTNCKIANIALPAAGQIYIDNDSLIGKIELTVDTYGRILDNQWLYASLGGTYRYPNALKSLGWPGVTLDPSESDIEIVYKGTSPYQQAVIALGGFTWANGNTGTFTANKVRVNYTNSNSGLTLQQEIAISAKSSIGEIELYGAELYSDLNALSGSIDVNTIRLKDNSTINFRKNPGFDNWRIGVASGNASGVTLSGGIVFESDTSSIKGDPGLRFINYGKAGGNVDIRNSKVIETLDTTPPVSGTA